MRKLYLLLDEWNNDKNFVGSEIEEIKKFFDVTIICNAPADGQGFIFPKNVKNYFYQKKYGIKAILYGLKFFIDSDSYKELKNLKGESHKFSKISEIIRFYINGELFYNFLKINDFLSKDTDAIFYSYWYFWKCFAVTKHRKQYPNINVISRTHEYDLYTVSIPSGYQPFKRLMDSNIDKLVFIAEHGRQFYIDRYGYEKSDKYLLYHLGTKDYGMGKTEAKSNTIQLVSCSSVIPRKRVELIVDALTLINDKEVHWVHFGNGEQFVELQRNATEKLSNKSNINYELKGYTPHDEVMRYYSENKVDAFMMMAVSEGNPVSVIEAMSFGIPVISVNINNMPNLIKGNGILLDKRPNPKDISKAIAFFENSKSNEIAGMRSKSREIWEQEYREDINIKEFVNEVLLKL